MGVDKHLQVNKSAKMGS
ncbi:protein of unknown function [Nitrospira defluvii]|uniref:Uncharacterized protein n=1 Tax=Nitrospira defluvii TaxID=330214 RepID=D8PIH9_9BACT|nr:protein of unknown function [Nitrospira defluvii]